ncbi:hypothetical protein [Flavobacterium sp.]|uniref:hypothetical protein n=1 Tax=Flavobacterium sp. TaxID=239 RepID=UPI002622A91B|nr:hypothetical protein [Flavobacterium sp.]MDG2433883.1 hypothetical protein [Flavobacterium sp.]
MLYLKDFLQNGKSYKIFTFYLIGTGLIQILSKIFLNLYANNLFLSHYYFIGQFILLSLFFKSLFTNRIQKSVANWILIIGLILLVIQYSINPAVFYKFNLFEIFVTSFLSIILAAMHLYNLLAEEKVFYYTTIGILLYLSGSTILFFVGNITAILSEEYQFLPWTVNAFLVVIYQLFILFQWRKISDSKKIITNNENKPI